MPPKWNKGPIPCECGCGECIIPSWNYKTRQFTRFKPYHHARLSRKLTPSQESSLIAAYLEGDSTYQLSEKFPVTPGGIRAILERRSIPLRGHRIYSIDPNFFEAIHSEVPAYWLGLIAADGYVGKGSANTFFLAIGLQYSDYEHLVKLKKHMNSTYPIRRYQKWNRAIFRVADNKMVRDLALYGITQRKTHILRYPTRLPIGLAHHFIRGYFDGDGCISGSSDHIEFQIAGQLSLLTRVQEILIKSCAVSHTKISKVAGSRSTHRLRYGGYVQVPRIMDWLYQDASVYLERKWKAYLELMHGAIQLRLFRP